MLEQLNSCLTGLRELRAVVKSEKGKTIGKQAIRKKAETVASTWLSQIGPQLESRSLPSPETVTKYSDLFRELLRITGPSNLTARYEQILKSLIKDFRKDLVLPLHEQPTLSGSLALLSGLFTELSSDENDYLLEAIGCAQRGYLRASVVLGWSAAIDRIHRRIEEIGLAKFNDTSKRLASQQVGRFKKFNQIQDVQSLAELREVFDNTVLWIIEGMGLVDSNQHTRLRSCFEMRCHSAHPGEAPITSFNLLSFYSDIKEIVLENPNFKTAAQTVSSST